MIDSNAQRVLDFWFGTTIGRQDKLWWSGGDAVDRQCRDEFMPQIEGALAGQLDSWSEEPTGAAALIILLDQLTRNVFRGTARAFAGDVYALAFARRLVSTEKDRDLHPLQRVFVYTPFEHAELLAEQDRAVSLFEGLIEEFADQAEYLGNYLRYARDHREIIERFGRFPHRNAVLGRASTPDEEAYLSDGGRRFGQ